MVGPQDIYSAGPNVNGVTGPNSGTNILTTSHVYFFIQIYIYINFLLLLLQWISEILNGGIMFSL